MLARVHLVGKERISSEDVFRIFSDGYANEVRVTNKSSVGDFLQIRH